MELGKLEIYKISLISSKKAWNIYSFLPIDLKYNIGSQFIRAIDSVGANIAEGYGRYHYKDSIKFYYNARGSLWESKHWVYLLHQRNLINSDFYNELLELLEVLGKKLNHFINRIKRKANVK